MVELVQVWVVQVVMGEQVVQVEVVQVVKLVLVQVVLVWGVQVWEVSKEYCDFFGWCTHRVLVRQGRRGDGRCRVGMG